MSEKHDIMRRIVVLEDIFKRWTQGRVLMKKAEGEYQALCETTDPLDATSYFGDITRLKAQFYDRYVREKEVKAAPNTPHPQDSTTGSADTSGPAGPQEPNASEGETSPQAPSE